MKTWLISMDLRVTEGPYMEGTFSEWFEWFQNEVPSMFPNGISVIRISNAIQEERD